MNLGGDVPPTAVGLDISLLIISPWTVNAWHPR